MESKYEKNVLPHHVRYPRRKSTNIKEQTSTYIEYNENV